MIFLILIPLALALVYSSIVDAEVGRIAEQNGLDGFDPDEPSIFDDTEAIFGTNEPNTLEGTVEPDVIFALGQTDLVRGLSGDDLIEAGTNNDTVFGGAGADVIGGGTGFDLLYGDRGDDVLIGNGGDDVLIGRDGDDLLIGGGGKDSLNGGEGDDFLISGNVEFDEEGEQDISATAFVAVRDLSEDELAEVDFDALEEAGALNGVDTSFLTEAPEPTQGGELRGGGGNDTFILAGGDAVQGNEGEDRFVLNEKMVTQNTVRIEDYISGTDVIAVEYSGDDAPVLETRDRGEDALVLIGDALLARVIGGAGLSVSEVVLVQST